MPLKSLLYFALGLRFLLCLDKYEFDIFPSRFKQHEQACGNWHQTLMELAMEQVHSNHALNYQIFFYLQNSQIFGKW